MTEQESHVATLQTSHSIVDELTVKQHGQFHVGYGNVLMHV